MITKERDRDWLSWHQVTERKGAASVTTQSCKCNVARASGIPREAGNLKV